MFQKIKDISFKDRIIIVLNVALIVIGVIVFQEMREGFIVFVALLFSWVSLWLLSGYAKERGLKIDFVSKLAITLLIVFVCGGYLFLVATAEVASVNTLEVALQFNKRLGDKDVQDMNYAVIKKIKPKIDEALKGVKKDENKRNEVVLGIIAEHNRIVLSGFTNEEKENYRLFEHRYYPESFKKLWDNAKEARNMDIFVEPQTLVVFFLGALITSFYLVFFKKLVGRFRKEK
ncbi:hypothetical protein [Helicobacter sp.]|uniref:hypothetical protein n=3 Tax=Helicobacter sp. TaxID=218 RepID=UPI002A74F05B|nr:hypothetical protein [Helicobacter sp.]MDY2584244.1 hypothetical protein [Helicobacter sp.]